ncbi:MAG: DNA mismatch repair endonuclease MutL [Chloroflexota bacterium]
MPIQVLPDVVAAQIAAGEVVERPASVVKELLENAIDAGATSIVVEIERGGQRLIRVSDDGTGIPAAEAALAFARHSTSKLRTVDDLNAITTLGFRGEALASIAAVSRTRLVTRFHEEQIGTELLVEGSELRAERPAGAPVGTVVEVKNLFFNTPARLKFLKSESTERRHITQLVTRYALAYPRIRFQLIQEGREQFHSTGSGDLADVLVEAFGRDSFRDMLEVSPLPPARPDLPPIEVYGFASVPALNRANRSHIVLFVNGRAIMDQSLSYAVVQAYHTLIPQGRYPLAVLMIALPPEEVDVNVHPTKAEVRFRAPDAVFSAVQRAVRQAVVGQAPVPSVDGTFPAASDSAWSAATHDYAPQGPASRPLLPGEEQLRLELHAFDAGRHARHVLPPSDFPPAAGRGAAPDPTAIPAGPEGPQRPRTLPILRVVGQVGAAYIVAEGPAGLYLIDQHAAHERILYEQFMAQQAAMQPVTQHTLPSATVELPAATALLVEENLTTLESLGFVLEPFGTGTFRVRAVPALLAGRDPAEVLHGLVEDLESGASPGETTLEARLIRRVCKAAAVKAGQLLSFAEMQTLIGQLERCESPHTCPHGRPTMLHISASELTRLFGRT